MKTKHALILAVLATLTSTASFAQQEGGGNRREMMKEKLREMDTNGDGAISKAEFMAGAEARFSKMDRNGDGKLDKEDRRGGGNASGAGNGAAGGGEQFP